MIIYNIIEAPLGFTKVFGHSSDVDWVKATENLGKTFFITSEAGLSIKPYPTCGFTHCAIDAALDIRDEHKVNAANIAEVSSKYCSITLYPLSLTLL